MPPYPILTSLLFSIQNFFSIEPLYLSVRYPVIPFKPPSELQMFLIKTSGKIKVLVIAMFIFEFKSKLVMGGTT